MNSCITTYNLVPKILACMRDVASPVLLRRAGRWGGRGRRHACDHRLMVRRPSPWDSGPQVSTAQLHRHISAATKHSPSLTFHYKQYFSLLNTCKLLCCNTKNLKELKYELYSSQAQSILFVLQKNSFAIQRKFFARFVRSLRRVLFAACERICL